MIRPAKVKHLVVEARDVITPFRQVEDLWWVKGGEEREGERERGRERERERERKRKSE